MSSDFNTYKKPKQKRIKSKNPETTSSRSTKSNSEEPAVPLQAKDSEWVDILWSNQLDRSRSSHTSDHEEMLQIVECEDGPLIKPLAILFPGLLNKDPQLLHGMLNKAMSTTEVTRHLVDLGEKANFMFMKQADRLIPREKKWLESLTENSNSFCSANSGSVSGSIASVYEPVKGSKNIYELKINNEVNADLRCLQNEQVIQDGNEEKPTSAPDIPE